MQFKNEKILPAVRHHDPLPSPEASRAGRMSLIKLTPVSLSDTSQSLAATASSAAPDGTRDRAG